MKWLAVIWFCLAILATPPNGASATVSESSFLLFGHDVVDLQRAAAERRGDRHEKDSSEPVQVEFTISPEPDIIMAYTADGTFEVDWVLFDPGTVSTMEIPQGTYEILVVWDDSYGKTKTKNKRSLTFTALP